MFFVSIGPNSERQRENGANQTIRRTWLGISLCFPLSLLKSTLPNPHTSTTRSTALQTCVISSEHLILSSVPLHHRPTTSITADDFATFFTDKTRTIGNQFSTPHTQDLQPTTSTAQTPIFSFCPLTEAEVSNFSSPAILQHVLLTQSPLTFSKQSLPHSYRHSPTLSTHLSALASSPQRSSRPG